MNLVHRHQSLRKKGEVATPAKKKMLVRSFDVLVYVVVALSLFFTLDQVRIVWVGHNASGVSLIAWSFYTISSCTWFCYGLIHKEKVIIVANFLWIILNGAVALGVLIYH